MSPTQAHRRSVQAAAGRTAERTTFQPSPHFTIFQTPQLRGGDRRVRGWGARTFFLWGGRVHCGG